MSPLLYVLALEPLLRRLRDRTTNPALRGVPFAGPLTARVSAFTDDITVFVSRRLDIKAVKKAVSEYERIAGAKVNFDKSEGLRLGAWRGSNTLPGPFHWSDGPVRILGVWFGPNLQLGCPRGVMVKAMNCGIVAREFVLHSRYYVHFRANTLGKGMNPLILPPAMGK